MKFRQLLESDIIEAYHGSPSNNIKEFNTTEVCVAKNLNEAKRYGKYIYLVTFKKFLFETKTIYVLNKEDVLSVKHFK